MRTRGIRFVAWIAGLATVLTICVYVVTRSSRDNEDLAEARKEIERREFVRASGLLDKHLDKYPSDAEALLLAARTARRQGAFYKSREYLRGYQDNGGEAEVVNLEGRLRLVQSGNLREVDSLLQLSENQPNLHDRAYILEAIIQGIILDFSAREKNGEVIVDGPEIARVDRALLAYTKLPLGSADLAEGHLRSGTVSLKIHRHENAARDLRRAVELAPDRFEARYLLVTTIAQESPRESVAHLEILCRMQPENFDVKYSRATVYRSLGETRKSTELFDELLASAPEHVELLLERASVDLDAGNGAPAEPLLRRALALSPHHTGVHLCLSKCLHLKGELAEAQRFYESFKSLEAQQKVKTPSMTPKP
jgi:Tfp pilus assembly protein PilF